MTKQYKIHVMGGEGTGWALDADACTTRESLSLMGNVKFVPLAEADIVHAVWEYPLLSLAPELLSGKRILCHLPNDVLYTYMQGCMARAASVGLWVPISRRAEAKCKAFGLRHVYVPYSVDTHCFTTGIPGGISQDTLRKQWNIPPNAYVVSNFMRDSAAHNLRQAKPQKGVESLVYILAELQRKGFPIHVLLAGPRRHWIRKRLTHYGVPFTFVGQMTKGDDNHINILPPETVNLLYHASNLHLITSRWEGGPRAIIEGAATRTPLLSTSVGLADDVLGQECLFQHSDEAVSKIESDLKNGCLQSSVDAHLHLVQKNHIPASNAERFLRIYGQIEDIPIFHPSSNGISRITRPPPSRPLRILSHALCMLQRRPPDQPGKHIIFGFHHEFHRPPYGGGNQFMLALKPALERLGVRVLVNSGSPKINIHLFNSAWFKHDLFTPDTFTRQDCRVLHRIDGPVGIYRGTDNREDERIFDLNRHYAAATIFQSGYCFNASIELGYHPVNPVVIHNAVNSRIFYPSAHYKNISDRRIRLISSAWSDNPRKGGPLMKWLDENLDFSKYEYTFVGRTKESFHNIRHIEAQSSQKLAKLLRNHDIFISPSHHEPCSNALLEAMSCGLPVLYMNDGGNPELVGQGGLPFNTTDDIMPKLGQLAEKIEAFRNMIFVDSIESVARRYIEVAQVALDSLPPSIT